MRDSTVRSLDVAPWHERVDIAPLPRAFAPRTFVKLPPAVRGPFEVYVNGVRQELGVDFEVKDGGLVFDRELRKDRISGWRWLLGAWGVGTYRQDDSVDVRYAAADGSPRVAEGLDVEPLEPA